MNKNWIDKPEEFRVKMGHEYQHLETDVDIHGRGMDSTVQWSPCHGAFILNSVRSVGCHDAGTDVVHAGRTILQARMDAMQAWRPFLPAEVIRRK